MDVTKDNHDEPPGLDASSKTNSETDHIVIEKVSPKPSVNVEEVSFDESPISGISTTSSSTASIDQTKPTMTRRQLFTVIVLCFINLLKYMDRFTIAGILPDIQSAFGINDAQGGLLSTAFVVSYMFFSPVFGYLGDRFSRRLIMGIGITFWSLSTLGGSFVSEKYGVFLTTRIMVGIGEAMFSTVSPTIISDVCVGDTRSKFLILYYFAIPVGSGLGFIVGALMASAFGSWQWGLRVTPVLGAIAVLLVIFVVQEPPRGEAEGSSLTATNYWDDIKYLATNKSFVLSTMGCTLVTYVSGALAWWGPKFVTLGIATTNIDICYSRVSLIVGFEAALAGVLGVASGSLLGQKLRKRYPSADALVCAWSMIICAPLLYWGIYIASGPAVPTYIVLFFGQLFMNINWAPTGDILLYVVIPTRRSTAEAITILVSHALGDAGSPYITGLISDSFRESLTPSAYPALYDQPVELDDSGEGCSGSSFIDPVTVLIDFTALQYSFFITTIIAALSAFFYFANAWYVVEDKAKVTDAVKENELLSQLKKLEENNPNRNPQIAE